MLEWAILYKPLKADKYIPVAGVNEADGQVIGYSEDDLLIGSFTFYRGPSYFEWYTNKQNGIIKNEKNGEWVIRFYHIRPDGRIDRFYHDAFVRLESINYNNSTNDLIIRFVNYAEYFLNNDFDISLRYGKPTSIYKLCTDIFTNYINVDLGGYVPQVNIVKNDYNSKDILTHFNWKGNGLDMINRLAQRYGMEFIIQGKNIHIGPLLFLGKKKDAADNYRVRGNIYKSMVGLTTSTVTTSIAPFPGHPFKSGALEGRVIVMDYYGDMDGTNCRVLTLPYSETVGEFEIAQYQRYITSNITRNKPIPQTHSYLGVNKKNEEINQTVQRQGGNVHKIYHEVFHSSQDVNNFEKYTIPDYDSTLNIRSLRASPFAGNTTFIPTWSGDNTVWGVNYPHMEGDLDVVNVIDGDMDKSITIGRMWSGDQPKRDDPLDYRLTFVDGSTIYEDESAKTIYMCGRNKLVFYVDQSMRWNLVPNANTTPSIEITTSDVIINNGTRKVARENDQIKSTMADDQIFWTWMKQLLATFNSHTHVAAGTPTAPPLPQLATSPSNLTGKIIDGSDHLLTS
jgi:hypothetical protein